MHTLELMATRLIDSHPPSLSLSPAGFVALVFCFAFCSALFSASISFFFFSTTIPID